MPRIRETLFALALVAAAGLVTSGAWLLDRAAGLIVGGLALAALSWAVLSE